MVGFCVQRGSLIGCGGSIADSDRVLYEPLVDCFGGVRHEDSSFEICFRQDVGQGSRMV